MGYDAGQMDATTTRHGVSWVWRGLVLLLGLGMLFGGWSSGHSVGSWIAMGLGVVTCIASSWSDASVAVRVDARGIWPVDPRRAPMAWRSMHEIVQRSNGIEVRDEAGRTLPLSSFLRGEAVLVRRAFQHAVESQRRRAELPCRIRSEDKIGAILFGGLAVGCMVFAVVALALDHVDIALFLLAQTLLLGLFAAWRWRQRFTETTIDADGITITRGKTRSVLPHGSTVDLLAVQHGQYSLHVWDAEARPLTMFGSSQGFAHVCAHLLTAAPYHLPMLPPIEPLPPTRRSEERRELALAWTRWWIGPSLVGAGLVFLVAPTPAVVPDAATFPNGWFVMAALSLASTLATLRRYRRRVRPLAIALGVIASSAGIAASHGLPLGHGTFMHATATTVIEGLLLLLAVLWLSRGSSAPDELASDCLQLGAAFGGVALLAYRPTGQPFWCLLLAWPLMCGAMVAAPWITWVHAKTPAHRRWSVPLCALAVVATTLFARVDFEEPRARGMAANLALGAALAVAIERERRAVLVAREPGAPMRELFLALTLGMIAALVYTASRTDASRLVFGVAFSPLLSGALILWIGGRVGTHDVPVAAAVDLTPLSPTDETARAE